MGRALEGGGLHLGDSLISSISTCSHHVILFSIASVVELLRSLSSIFTCPHHAFFFSIGSLQAGSDANSIGVDSSGFISGGLLLGGSICSIFTGGSSGFVGLLLGDSFSLLGGTGISSGFVGLLLGDSGNLGGGLLFGSGLLRGGLGGGGGGGGSSGGRGGAPCSPAIIRLSGGGTGG